MKKFLALLFAMILTISCLACAPDTQGTEPTHDHTHTQETTEVPTQETSEETTCKQIDSPPQTNSEKTEETPQPSTEKSEQITENILRRGTTNNNTYKSSFTNLKFTKPSDWKFLSDEELAMKIGVDEKDLADYVFHTTADRVPAVYDMWATNPSQKVNISVAYENMYVTASVAMTADEYLEMLKGAFENTKGTNFIEKSTVNLSGQTYLKAVFETKTGGTSTQNTYYLRGMGKFMNIVLVTAPIGAEHPDIEKMFT